MRGISFLYPVSTRSQSLGDLPLSHPALMSILDFRFVALIATAVAVAHGTY